MPRSTLPIIFGNPGGLDRGGSPLVTGPERMEIARNVRLGDGGVDARRGLVQTGTVESTTYQAALVAGRVRNTAIAVDGYGVPGLVSHQLKVSQRDGDGTGYDTLGTWLNPCNSTERARVLGVEAGGYVFLAHDEVTFSRRGKTIYVNLSTGAITTLTAAWADGGDPDYNTNLRFRGVTTHLDRLVGWGFGTNADERPNMARISNADNVLLFDEADQVTAGQAADPLLHCMSYVRSHAGGTDGVLLMLKESEVYYLTGYDNRTFAGPYLLDRRHGLASSRLICSDGVDVFFWSPEGPRVFRGVGPSENISWRLGLNWPRSEDLAAMDLISSGFSEYLPRKGGGMVVFVFGTFVYSLDLRTGEWTHDELAIAMHCGAVLYAAQTYQGPSRGYPDFDTAAALDADSERIDYANVLEEGDETVELFIREVGGSWPAEPNDTNAVGDTPSFQVDSLAPGDYEVALRYNRDGQYSTGYTGDPDTWPAVSLGTFTVSGDAPPVDLLPPTDLNLDDETESCEPMEPPAILPCMPQIVYELSWTNQNGTDGILLETRDKSGSTWVTADVLAPATTTTSFTSYGDPDTGFVDEDGRSFRIRHSRDVSGVTYYSDPSAESNP